MAYSQFLCQKERESQNQIYFQRLAYFHIYFTGSFLLNPDISSFARDTEDQMPQIGKLTEQKLIFSQF